MSQRKQLGQKRRRDGVQCKDFQVKFDTVSENGQFVGYGSVFGVVDSYNEVVAPGAFTQTIKDIKASGRMLPVLWNHRSDEPLGAYTDLREDERGLYVEGMLLVGSVKRAGEVAALANAGAVSGLSIGYWIKDESYDQETGVWTLKELKLREVSLVTFPANEEARLETVKMKLAGGTLPTLREFELILRDAGFSKREATSIAAKGYHDIGAGDPGPADMAATITASDLRAAFGL